MNRPCKPFASSAIALRATAITIGLALLLLLTSLTLRAGRTASPSQKQQPSSGSSAETPFLFGADWPVNGSPAVKSLFYETGFNFVRITGGGYNWALDGHRKALEELNGHGVTALLQLGSHYPEARYFELKDSYFVDQKGETGKEDRSAWAITYSGSAWPQYSHASARFREELAKDFTTYLNGLKEQKNVSALLLHNEPGYHWLADRMFDYNPQAIAAFRASLRRQHGTLEKLNERWGTRFASFDAVEPPREMPPVDSIGAWLDWRRFNADLIRDFLHSQIAFANRIRPGLPTTTNLAGPLDNWFPIRLGDNYRFTADFDIAGIDIYPTEWSGPVFVGYAMDMTRGAGQSKRIYVAECEVFDPTRFKGLTEEQRAGMLRGQVWTFIGHGADAVLLWSLAGQEGFRLTERGEFNPRVAATREIAHLSPMLRLGSFRKPERPVALVVDQDSYLYYGGREKAMDGAFRVDNAARGLYGAVAGATERHGIDIISAAQVRQGVGKRYKALVLSMPVLMDAELATQIKTFVQEGGLLVAEAPFATRDRWGKELPSAPGFGLDAVLGIRDVKSAAETASGSETITTSDGSFPGAGRTQFEMAGARVAGGFADRKPAVTHHTFGKGTAVYIAAEVGGPSAERWATSAGPDESGLRRLFALLLIRNARLQPGIRVAHQGATYLDTSVRSDARGNRLIVLANPTNRGKPLPPATQVNLSAAVAAQEATGTQAFVFPPARRFNGRTVAGPQPVRPRREGADRIALSLPDIDSALPVLLAHDFTPLLRIDAPETAAPGAEVEVKVTCYNPSPRPLRVTPGLVLPPSWKPLGRALPVTIPARGEHTVVLRASRPGTSEERAVIKAHITYRTGNRGGTASVRSVPVDIYATATVPR